MVLGIVFRLKVLGAFWLCICVGATWCTSLLQGIASLHTQNNPANRKILLRYRLLVKTVCESNSFCVNDTPYSYA